MSALNIYPSFQWTTGQTMTAQLLNNPLAAIQAWSTTIDNTNLTGGAGIFASQIVPLNTTQATFGGAVGYTFVPGSTTQTPLTVSGVGGQSADIFDVTATSGGQKLMLVGANGNVQILGGTQTSLVVSALTAISAPAGIGVGDITAQENASSGQFAAGGATHSGRMDYGIQAAQAWTWTADGTKVFQVLSSGQAIVPALAVTAAISVTSGQVAVNTNGVGQFFDCFSNSGTWNFRNNVSSSVANINASGVYTATSDERLKQNFAPIKQGLTELLTLKPLTFTWNKDGSHGQGFSAQEVQAVLPECVAVVDEKAGTLGISDSLMTPVIVKAIQDLTAEVRSYITAHP